MLTLWGRASSVNVQKVLWALDELGLSHERIDAGGRYGGVDTDAFAALNPNRRVPVLQDGDLTLWESDAILRWLAQREGRLMPEAPEDRARAEQWLCWSAGTLQPPFVALFWQAVRLPEAERDARVAARARAELEAALGILDGVLARQGWLTGAAFGIADIAAGSLMHRIAALGLMTPARPALGAWAARLAGRPAWRRHIATSFDELRAASAPVPQ